MKSKYIFFALLLIIALLIAGCGPYSNANGTEADQVNQQQAQYVNGQPVPQFTWSLERHELIEIYKARNNAVSTYAVIYNPFKGVIQFECPSYGYPIPGGTELTNPQAISRNYFSNGGYEYGTLPQAEPNGTYSPSTSAGTYIMCRADDGTAYPVYVEDNVLTFPYPVTTDASGRLVKDGSDAPSIAIDVKQPAVLPPTPTTVAP